ncbi:TolC family protein [Szabonella alba]|uniref:TolC family protein n=1 Tax=Szabonella alba TaxID=2804194 RepID=A0A8K0Y1Y2_9RHOB|nr:TolC family protein [Szabonella alba]MBL4919411.1 TolC family protein [Szabonella alba]
MGKINLKVRPVIAGCFLLFALPATAQVPLHQAVLVASERDPGITALRFEIDRRSVDIQAVRDQNYPQLSLSADTATTSSDGPGVTLTVSQVLYDWGRVRNMVASASQERVIAVSDLKQGIEEITLDVSNYYIDVTVLDQKIARTRDYLAFARRIADHAEARWRAGRGDNGEVARARLEVSRTEQRLDQLSSDRMLAMAQLEFLMGRNPGRITAPVNLDFIGRYSNGDAVTSAIRLSPSYIAAQAGFARADAEIGVAKAARLPTIRLQAQVRGDLDRGRTRSSVGLSTGLDLGAGAITGRQIQSARLQAEAARSNLDAVSRNMRNSVRSALEQIRVLRASETSQARQLSQAQQVLDNYEAQFVGGQRELIDLLTTGRDLYDAQIDRIDTYDERERTEYRAAFELGVLGTLILAASRQG